MKEKIEKCRYCGTFLEAKTTRKFFCSTKCRVYWNRGLVIWKVYTLSDPQTESIFYVGVTKGTLKNRLYGHIYAAQNLNGKTVSRKDVKILSILSIGEEPLIEQIEEISGHDVAGMLKMALEKEASWTVYFKNQGIELVNVLLQNPDGSLNKILYDKPDWQEKEKKSMFNDPKERGRPKKEVPVPPTPIPAGLKGIDLLVRLY